MTIMSGKLPCPPPHNAPNGPDDDAEPGACVEPEPGAARCRRWRRGARQGAADGGGAAGWRPPLHEERRHHCCTALLRSLMGWACTARTPFRQLNLEIASAAGVA